MKGLAGTLTLALLLSVVAHAQDNRRAEITGDYSYFRLNPELPSLWNSQNLNVGGGQLTLYRQQLHGWKQQPEQLPLPDRSAVPLLTSNNAYSWHVAIPGRRTWGESPFSPSCSKER